MLILGLIYNAQFLTYDINYTILLLAVILSLSSFIGGVFALKKKIDHWVPLLFQQLLSGPITVFYLIINYPEIFACTLQT